LILQMKKILYLTLLLALACRVPPAGASWLIDVGAFSKSVHAENSCQDCHAETAAKTLHPDPKNVTRKSADFFSTAQCNGCHEAVSETLGRGTHGGKPVVQEAATYENCLRCHDPHAQARKGDRAAAAVDFSEDDRACLTCHAALPLDGAEGRDRVARLCLHCHGQSGTRAQQITAGIVPLLDAAAYDAAAHQPVNCLVCHPRAPAFEHQSQTPADCRQCHLPHPEKVARDVHLTVGCPACHLQNTRPVRDADAGRVLWVTERDLKTASKIHNMRRSDDDAFCRRCHFRDNNLGAAAMLLPAKSVLCMPCHSATFSFGDTTTLLALLVFLFGLAAMFSYSLTGSPPAGPGGRLFQTVKGGARSLFSPRIAAVFKTALLDVLVQRKLYRRSFTRWLIHGLIFFPFAFRFLWGMLALLGSLWLPGRSAVWLMLDKNAPLTAFAFDLTGVMIILGSVLALGRGMRPARRPNDLPAQDRPALGLIGGIVAIGFVLEGMRIAMTGHPPGSGFAFVGYGFSLFFDGSAAVNYYGFVWYLHAILAGMFIAYLPFSRLFHIIAAPIVLLMNAVAASEHENIKGI